MYTIEYVYLLRLREHEHSKEPVYKVGSTIQTNLQRISAYPKGSALELHIRTENCRQMEKKIIKLFKKKYKPRRDIGTEYFEGDWNLMRCDILRILGYGGRGGNKKQKRSVPAVKVVLPKADDDYVYESPSEDEKCIPLTLQDIVEFTKSGQRRKSNDDDDYVYESPSEDERHIPLTREDMEEFV